MGVAIWDGARLCSGLRMNKIDLQHDALTRYLATLLAAYFELLPVGRILQYPFIMQIDDAIYQPDIQIVLRTNPAELSDTALRGAADICIEVVAPESTKRDHGDLFAAYEQAGVAEYWIVDGLRHESRFYRLGDNGRYVRVSEEADGHYRTPRLAQFRLNVSTLWEAPLPGPLAIGAMVRAMVQRESN
ncbi:MAG: Uma2 family endonuclease, partial [Chloroflexi bacterium]